MNNNWKWRTVVSVLLGIFAFVYLLPSFMPEKNWLTKAKLKLGLDLQGGMHIVMGINPADVLKDSIKKESDTLKDHLSKKGVTGFDFDYGKASGDDPRFVIKFSDPSTRQKILDVYHQDFESTMRLSDESNDHLEFGVQQSHKKFILDNGLDQALQVIRNRVDEFGVSEPAIQKAGNDRIAIQLPGLKDPGRAKELIGQTAKLQFQLVSNTKSPAEIMGIVEDFQKQSDQNKPENFKSFNEYVRKVNDFAKSKIPEGTEIAFQREDKRAAAQGQSVAKNIPYLLESKADVTGEDLKDAFVTMNHETNMPVVSLSFNPRGAKKFADLTGASIHRNLAIVLDGVVHSAPTIQDRISGGNAQITLGWGDYNTVFNEASDISIVLRAGALPVRLELREERIVGPSLGRDSIDSGKKSMLVGSAIVVVFMIVYYGVSGLIADIALGLNMLLLLAMMTAMESTLTLPGIAGLALTVGMAVDGNIIIFERIREELAEGKDEQHAIEEGFDRAFATILDANICHTAAAYILYVFGTGPIQGFAITLLVGIISTVFTNTFVSKALFGLYFHFKPQTAKLSI